MAMPRVEDVKFYPDQPIIDNTEIPSGLQGTRTDSTAIVPTAAGTLVLPEVRVPWWDTETGALRYATLPARTLTVAPAANAVAPSQPGGQPQADEQLATPSTGPGALPWQIATAVCAVGWLATLLLWFRRGKTRIGNDAAPGEQPSRKAALRQMMAACTANHAAQARHWFIRWTAAAWDAPGITSAAAAAACWDSPDLDNALQTLEASLFAPDATPWQGSELGAIVKQLEVRPRGDNAAGPALAPLYPDARAAT
jgi:hypothetical protein